MQTKLRNKSKKTRKALSKAKRRFLKHIWLARLSLLLVVLFILGLLVWAGVVLFNASPLKSYFSPARNFVLNPQGVVSSIDGRTNVLVLGRGGEGHEAPDLTDTIIFGSVSQNNKAGVLVSLPRDIWVPDLRAKLNAAYYWGKQKDSKSALLMAKSSVEAVVGQPIQYVVVIDFSGFKRVIDALGGVEVEVERAFTDDKYPIAGRENDLCGGDTTYACRYETIHFDTGVQTMNGETALKFVRSRHAPGDDGTDIARAARQQKLIEGIKNKILTSGILFNPEKLAQLGKVVEGAIETDISSDTAGVLARWGYEAKENLHSYVLSEEFLVNPPLQKKYDRQYVFIPKVGDGNWSQVHEWVRSILP